MRRRVFSREEKQLLDLLGSFYCAYLEFIKGIDFVIVVYFVSLIPKDLFHYKKSSRKIFFQFLLHFFSFISLKCHMVAFVHHNHSFQWNASL